ncbi:MAG: hypothetical protein ABSG25_07010 [Bryobacteraceae bacterium]
MRSNDLKKALEPYIKLSPFFGIGLVLVAITVVWIFYIQRGAHVDLAGGIQKVRTMALDDNSSVAVVDFRFVNTSDYLFIVRTADVYLTGQDGQETPGEVVSEVDAQRLFQYYPVLGQKFNDSLLIRTKIKPHQSMDRMLAVRFEMPEKQLEARQQLRIRIEELDGPISNLVEVRKK